ncbi:MAG: hypothetical protein OES59_06355, partial [Gammaproteobacteria bacterium]|nr:hypothetical protein [Gammaproteobacteria bacterium]
SADGKNDEEDVQGRDEEDASRYAGRRYAAWRDATGIPLNSVIYGPKRPGFGPARDRYQVADDKTLN